MLAPPSLNHRPCSNAEMQLMVAKMSLQKCLADPASACFPGVSVQVSYV